MNCWKRYQGPKSRLSDHIFLPTRSMTIIVEYLFLLLFFFSYHHNCSKYTHTTILKLKFHVCYLKIYHLFQFMPYLYFIHIFLWVFGSCKKSNDLVMRQVESVYSVHERRCKKHEWRRRKTTLTRNWIKGQTRQGTPRW